MNAMSFLEWPVCEAAGHSVEHFLSLVVLDWPGSGQPILDTLVSVHGGIVMPSLAGIMLQITALSQMERTLACFRHMSFGGVR